MTEPVQRQSIGGFRFSEVQFVGLSAWGMDQTITVEWTDQSGERQHWSKPLPPNGERSVAVGPPVGKWANAWDILGRLRLQNGRSRFVVGVKTNL